VVGEGDELNRECQDLLCDCTAEPYFSAPVPAARGRPG
jgi:hypothetical protein